MATAGAMNLVELTSVSYINVNGTETVEPTTGLKEMTASEIQQGKFNFDDPAVSTTEEYAADGTTYRSREGNSTPSVSLSLHSVTLEKAADFLKGSYTAAAGENPASIDTIGNEIVSNKYIKVVGLNSLNQVVTYILYNAKITTSQSGNIDKAQEVVPLLIKGLAMYHPGLGKTLRRQVAP